MSSQYDIMILGRGAAPFASAIKASESSDGNVRIAMVRTGPIGGACANVGVRSLVPASSFASSLLPRASKVLGNSLRAAGNARQAGHTIAYSELRHLRRANMIFIGILMPIGCKVCVDRGGAIW